MAQFRDLAAGSLSPAEEALAAVELTDGAIIVRDVGSVVRMWNPAAEALYGFTRDEAVGCLSHDLLRTRFPSPYEEIEQALFALGSWEGPLLHTARDGETLMVASRWVLQRTPDGEPNAIMEFNRRTDPNEEPWRVAPVGTPVAERVYLHEPVFDDYGELADVVLRYVNDQARILEGDALVLGRPSAEWYPGLRDTHLFDAIRRVVTTGEPCELTNVHLQPPWLDEPHVIDGRVVPFGDLVAVRARDVTAERRAVQALNDAQARVRLAVAAAPVWIVQTDADLVVEWISAAGTPDLGEPLLGRSVADVFVPGDRRRLRDAVDRVLGTGEELRLELRPNLLGGPTVMDVVIQPRRSGPEIVGVVLAGVDVSDYRRVQGELEASQTLLRTVLDQIDEAVWLRDRQGRCRFANRRAAEMVGRTPEATVGRTDVDLLDFGAARRQRDEDAAVFAGGGPTRTVLEVGGPDGWRTTAVQRFPVLDEHGRVEAVGALVADITDDVRRDAELRQHAAALELAGVASAAIRRRDGRFAAVGEAWGRLFGWDPRELTGQPVRVLGAHDGANALASLAAALEERGSGTFRLPAARRDGTTFTAELRVGAAEDSEHGPIWVVVARDLTAELEREERLAYAEARLAEHGLR